jgi:molybdopterin converting factor small subunit
MKMTLINGQGENTKTIRVEYFAILKERRGCSSESIETNAANVRDLYSQLAGPYNFPLPPDSIRVAVNHKFVDWGSPIAGDDIIVFIPPVAGG